MCKRLITFICLLLLAAWRPADGKTLILEGKLDSQIQITQNMTFSVTRPVARLTLRFTLPATFSNRAVAQDIRNLDVTFKPRPATVEDETDSYGNRFRRVTWTELTSDAQVAISFEALVRSQLAAMESKAAFPLKTVPQTETTYLKSTEMAQATDPGIAALAQSLTSAAATEYEAVNAILNYVSDNIKYSYNPTRYDAVHTLATRSGNCQNFAHFSMALLRSVGIPARIVGGISLKEPWKVPVDNSSSLVQSMGQGGHAWMEIYFPDLGWLSYDAQQSKQFTSSRHIKQTHGLDSRDINDTWRGTPYLPAYSELIEAKFIRDSVALQLKKADSQPRPYIISNNLLAKLPAPETAPTPASTPPPRTAVPTPAAAVPPPPPLSAQIKTPRPATSVMPPPPTAAPAPAAGERIEFGNIEFPTFVDIYRVAGNEGTRVLDKETSEYVTSRHVFAQAFTINRPLALEKVSLAMHKFGGDGTVYLDLVADDGGKPGLAGFRSQPLFLENISRKPGYYWVDFSFPPDVAGPPLKNGKYWIVLRHSGEAVLNWFYIPGKPYSGGDDTRSTARGYRWEDIRNYDFVFKVTGKTPQTERR